MMCDVWGFVFEFVGCCFWIQVVGYDIVVVWFLFEEFVDLYVFGVQFEVCLRNVFECWDESVGEIGYVVEGEIVVVVVREELVGFVWFFFYCFFDFIDEVFEVDEDDQMC